MEIWKEDTSKLDSNINGKYNIERKNKVDIRANNMKKTKAITLNAKMIKIWKNRTNYNRKNIPMNETHRMNTIQCQNYFSNVKFCPFFRNIIIAHKIDQITTWHIIHDHVKVFFILKCIMQL